MLSVGTNASTFSGSLMGVVLPSLPAPGFEIGLPILFKVFLDLDQLGGDHVAKFHGHRRARAFDPIQGTLIDRGEEFIEA
ncbi:hypothetical protein [Ensifer sp. B1-9]|uniref:hypothetical protein n=1 Tax=Ensifer sp. B1-9 TaxID=3141455 RepID=UPI003D22B0D1